MADAPTRSLRYDPHRSGDGSCDCGAHNWASRTEAGPIWLSDGSYLALCLSCGWWEAIRGGPGGSCSVASDGRRWRRGSGRRGRRADDFEEWAASIVPEARSAASARLQDAPAVLIEAPDSAISGEGGAGVQPPSSGHETGARRRKRLGGGLTPRGARRMVIAGVRKGRR